MTISQQNKIPEDKIKSNASNYILNRQSAIISALADGDFDKYEYLTRIDLTLKPNLLEKVRFEHSPLRNLLSKLLGKQRDDNEQDREEESKSIEDFVERLTRLRDDIGERRDAINQATEEMSRHIQTAHLLKVRQQMI